MTCKQHGLQKHLVIFQQLTRTGIPHGFIKITPAARFRDFMQVGHMYLSLTVGSSSWTPTIGVKLIVINCFSFNLWPCKHLVSVDGFSINVGVAVGVSDGCN